MPNNQNANAPLNRRLLLTQWFVRKLGWDDLGGLLAHTKDLEGWDDQFGIHRVMVAIQNHLRDGQGIIGRELLTTMDGNIRADLARINKSRPEPVSLKYFQYLAALSAEYLLHRIAESKGGLAEELNEFTKRYAPASVRRLLPECDSGNPAHLSKLAFWMATGAGKTLLMHLNYLQFLRANIFAPDNILLITPGADMSAQHLDELRASSIPCRPFGEAADLHRQKNAVLVLDIHKLAGKKLPPETFSGKNLIFVDEGHKGTGGSVWFDIRDRLAKNGFAMEYSATFGNAVAALPVAHNQREQRAEEYARAVAFDYSYGYFHGDGYGKDYFILNMDDGGDDENDERRQTLMTGNLLAFFQQQLAHSKHPDTVREYQIAPPLLLMLGATVTGGNKTISDPQKRGRADILNLVDFLRLAASEKTWLEQTAKKILNNNSGLLAKDGKDLFAEKFQLLIREYGNNAARLCEELREHVFHMKEPGDLKIRPIKKTMQSGGGGEIALRAENAKPCALVYVGAARQFADMCRERFGESEVLEDPLQRPLFAGARDSESPVNILIGAKKFMEGWSSWRVSGIGLLNIGRSEGAMIVQLFGRGVRLQGKNWSLKRDAAYISGDKKETLEILETLNIFGIRANFMSEFRDYLRREGTLWREVSVPIELLPANMGGGEFKGRPEEVRKQRLPVPSFPPPKNLKGIALEKENVRSSVNLTASVVAIQPGETTAGRAQGTTKKFDPKHIDIEQLYLRFLRDYKPSGGGLAISREQLREVLSACKYSFNADAPPSPARLQDAAFAAVRQHADKLVARRIRNWQRDNTRLEWLEDGRQQRRGNFMDYTIRLLEDSAAKVEEIQEIIKKESFLLYLREVGGNTDLLSRIHFSGHLVQPLLTENPPKLNAVISPPPLNDGEKQFMKYLRDYALQLSGGDTIYALRNQAKHGIGFVLKDNTTHYPDFMLWVVGKSRRRLVFAEPHGMRNENIYENCPKARLWEWMAEWTKNRPSQSRRRDNLSLEMDSFIVSVTPREEMENKWNWDGQKFTDHHILFMEDLADENLRGKTFARMFYPNGGN